MSSEGFIRLFLVGDVMLGRGIDQVQETSCDPILYEDYVKDAREYVDLAVRANGPLPAERGSAYVWGDALEILDDFRPDVRIINLETAITTSSSPWPHKGINYRMHPANIDLLTTAKIDCAVLSNNHTLDWDYDGLVETLSTINDTEFVVGVGAGTDLDSARKPGIFGTSGGSKPRHTSVFGEHLSETQAELQGSSSCRRVLVFGVGHGSSGIPQAWKATPRKAGVNFIKFESSNEVKDFCRHILDCRQPGDMVVVSVHWGGNWGFDLEPGQQKFAHTLIDEAGVDVVHGHSSHHIKGVEVYKGKLIAYGCGDFISDYEGIQSYGGGGKYAGLRDTYSFMYFADIDPDTGALVDLTLVPMELKNLRVNLATARSGSYQWLYDNMNRECKRMTNGRSIVRAKSGQHDVFKLVL